MDIVKYKQGDINPTTGKVYWSRDKNCKDGVRWMTPEQYKIKREQITAWKQSAVGKTKTKLARNTESQKEKRRQYSKIYNKSPERRAKANAYAKQRRRQNVIARLAERSRARLREAINNGGFSKKSSTNTLLGCSWDQYKEYLESLFLEGMSWDNYSLWHIDHIIPLSFAKTEDEIYKYSHYTNTQPLWASDNHKKSNKLPESLLQELAETSQQLGLYE